VSGTSCGCAGEGWQCSRRGVAAARYRSRQWRAFSAAAAGVLVNVGAPNIVTSAHYLMFGFAVAAVLGVLPAVASIRTPAQKRPARAITDRKYTDDPRRATRQAHIGRSVNKGPVATTDLFICASRGRLRSRRAGVRPDRVPLARPARLGPPVGSAGLRPWRCRRRGTYCRVVKAAQPLPLQTPESPYSPERHNGSSLRSVPRALSRLGARGASRGVGSCRHQVPASGVPPGEPSQRFD
jgi:hypothetical protein